jgi:hypothetical protein
VTADVGPRIIRFGFIGEENEFKEYGEQIGRTGGDEWNIFGGHRLWHAPEAQPRTYYPDNGPVEVSWHDDHIHTVQAVESTTGIQKEMEIRLAPNRAQVEVTHRLRNTGPWEVELAPWALSVMAPGGTAIVPLPARGSHPADLLPTSSVALWPFTNMGDPRWSWGENFILLRQDVNRSAPQKIGVLATGDPVGAGWIAYARKNLFLKAYHYFEEGVYPDLGSTVETFTNEEMLEVETLGPVEYLGPGDAIDHVEDWFLFRDVAAPQSDADVENNVLPCVRSVIVDE